MKEPLVTVYVTNHNYGEYLEQAIGSVLDQTMDNFELIIIDDGSTDNSREILEKYRQHPKIALIFQKNKGLNVTNNIALRSALGKYIMRLDADDFLDHNALLVLSNTLEQDPELGLVFPDYYLVDGEGNILNLERRHSFAKEVSLLDQPAHGACTMIRRKFLLHLRGYSEHYSCQDGYELWIKFASTYKVTNVNTPLFYYRQHQSNLTSNESRILETRKQIKQDYATEKLSPLKTVAIIPVRSGKTSRYNLVFEKIAGKFLIDLKIETALQSTSLNQIIITSPDETVKEHISKQYKENPRVFFIKRPPELTQLNIGLSETINLVLEAREVHELDPDLLLILAMEFPFLSAGSIDEAINTIGIFGPDSLISVRPDTSMFFQHQGSGMSPILNQEKFTRLEREALYKFTGGIIACRALYFKEHQKLIGGNVGHIVVNQKGAHGIYTSFDLKLAEYMFQLPS